MVKKKQVKDPSSGGDGLHIAKTFKLFINGAFPRSESGAYTKLMDAEGKFLANISKASRKDFRDAVVAARTAQGGWADRTAYNRSQIIYRIAEVMEQRRAEFMAQLMDVGHSTDRAGQEFNRAIDKLVHYAGWCDKYVQVFSSVNPVSGSYFNFSMPEAMGVIASIAPGESGLDGLVQAAIPAICGGNTVIALASELYPTAAITFAEVLATSDVPAGVINILTGTRKELMHHFASHMDINAVAFWGAAQADAIEVSTHAADSVKRVFYYPKAAFYDGHPKQIMDLQEIKTTWHPIENISGSVSGY